jgi:putative oxidoreductase
VQNDGIEFPLVMALIPAALAFTGPGRWAVGPLLGLVWPDWVAPAAVAVGILAGLGTRIAPKSTNR